MPPPVLDLLIWYQSKPVLAVVEEGGGVRWFMVQGQGRGSQVAHGPAHGPLDWINFYIINVVPTNLIHQNYLIFHGITQLAHKVDSVKPPSFLPFLSVHAVNIAESFSGGSPAHSGVIKSPYIALNQFQSNKQRSQLRQRRNFTWSCDGNLQP